MKFSIPLLCPVLCLLGACSSSRADNRAEDQQNGSCPSSTGLVGQGQSGAFCSDASLDCLPTCCICGNAPSFSYLAAECGGSVCQDSSTTCNDLLAVDRGLCP